MLRLLVNQISLQPPYSLRKQLSKVKRMAMTVRDACAVSTALNLPFMNIEFDKT
jgi:hypothetical protein